MALAYIPTDLLAKEQREKSILPVAFLMLEKTYFTLDKTGKDGDHPTIASIF